MNHFWTFRNAADGCGGEGTKKKRDLLLDGEIASESWWGDEVTPAAFREELNASDGDIDVYINSPGGDCVAASQIYTMLAEYSDHNRGLVTVKIDGMAASAASVIAMAGDRVLMARTALLMIHNPLTFAFGNEDDMRAAIDVLSEFKESIINAYEKKTGLSRAKISRLMDDETWMNARKALELGFCDGMIGEEAKGEADGETGEQSISAYAFSARTGMNSLCSRIAAKAKENASAKAEGKQKPDTSVRDGLLHKLMRTEH